MVNRIDGIVQLEARLEDHFGQRVEAIRKAMDLIRDLTVGSICATAERTGTHNCQSLGTDQCSVCRARTFLEGTGPSTEEPKAWDGSPRITEDVHGNKWSSL